MALTNIAEKLTASPGLPHQTCGTCHALASMSDEDAATLRRLLSDRSVPLSDLARALADDDESPTITRQSLSRHARGDCSANEALRS